MNVTKLYQSLGNSLCVALPMFHTFTGSGCTGSFIHKVKIRPLKLLERSEDAKKDFFVLKGQLLSEGKLQQLLKSSRSLLLQCISEKYLLQFTKYD